MSDGIPSPNPDFPQNIEVVTGDNVVKHTGKNLLNLNNRIKNVASGVSLVTDSVQPNSFRMGGKSTWGNYVFVFNNKPNTDYGIRARFKSTVATTIRLSVYGTNVFDYTTSDLTALGHSDITSLPANTDVDLSVTFNSGSYKYLIIRFWNNYTGTALTEMTDMLIDNIQLEEGSTPTTYEPYREKEYELSLGNIELCKIGDYKDILFKNVAGDENYNAELEEGAWYKKGVIRKYTTGVDATIVSTTGYRIRLKNMTELHDMESSTNVRAYGLSTNSIVNQSLSDIRYNGGWKGLALVYKQELRNMIGEFSTDAELLEWFNNNVTVYAVINPTYDYIDYTKITDTTLISQLEALSKAKWFKGINHWWTETENLEPVLKGTYKQSNNLKNKERDERLDNLESRLALLE